ncbi:MAG: glycosyltransferase family 2 protein [Trichocoleus desertorum ATA4-8-CV12]|jgi:glycosyltransferase involved in cell wall biosynthesis|nr:glycosyltransferase family 2 protein [Trichocoleus desertorum ATA4-8-CV12]
MSSQFPLVSVIIPAYNTELYIGPALESVLSQTYQNIEVLVVDDGSKDRTAEIVESFVQKDPRVQLFRQKNAGVAAARNLAIAHAQGEYIAPIDADDIWYPQKLEKQVQCMLRSGPEVGLVYTWSVHIDESGSIIGEYKHNRAYKPEGDIYPILVYFNFLDNASNTLIRRTCIERVGGFNPELRAQNAQGCEDWELYLRIADAYEFRVVPEFLVGYRQLLGSMASNSKAMAKSYQLVMVEVQARHPEIPKTIYRWSRGCFYHYLMGKSYQSGTHWSTLQWLYLTLKDDPSLLLRPGLYPMILTCLLKIATKPITSLIWSDHRSWVEFRQRFRLKPPSLTIEEVNDQEKQRSRRILKPYDWVLLWRWEKAMKICHQLTSTKSNNPQKLLILH